MDESTIRALGTPIGSAPRNFPGLAPVTKRLKDCLSDVTELEKAKYELDSIRATILVNFGSPANGRHGFTITEGNDISTERLVMQALEYLTRKD